MRQDSDGRDTMPLWSLTQRVFGAIDGCPGDVVSVGNDWFAVQWSDGTRDAVVYPEDTIMVRKGFPWE